MIDSMNEPPQPDYEALSQQLRLLAVRLNWLARVKGGEIWTGSNPKAVLMHQVSELSEAFQVLKEGKHPGFTWAEPDRNGNPKPEGFRVELADAIIGIVHLGEIHGGIGEAIALKMEYREAHGWGRSAPLEIEVK